MIIDYMTLFPGGTREKPRFTSLAQAILHQIEDLQTLVPDLESAFSPAHAVGVQLEALGASLSVLRQKAWPDETYREIMKRKLKRNRWPGTNETAFDCVEEGEAFCDNSNGTVTASTGKPISPNGILPVPIGVKAI